ncbi:hypothetical protein [Shewanella woodyi]
MSLQKEKRFTTELTKEHGEELEHAKEGMTIGNDRFKHEIEALTR